MLLDIADGHRLSYDVVGRGPVVVFSHGVLMDSTMWRNQVAEFSPDVTAVSWDERGHGQTVSGGKPFDYWDSARDLLALLDHLEVDRAVLVGHSQGGFLSMRLALLAPERVAGLVFVPSHSHGLDDATKDAFEQTKAAWQAGGPAPVQDTLLGILVGEPSLYPAIRASWERLDRAAVGDVFDTLISLDELGERPGEINAPSLVVHGGADQAMPIELGRDLAGRLGNNVGFEVIPGAGHAPSLTHPEAFNPLLRTFVADYAAPAGSSRG